MTRRTVYLWLPRFATALAFRGPERGAGRGDGRARCGSDPARPAILTRIGAGGPQLAAVNAPGEAAGLRVGMALADARALAPALRAVAQDGKAEERAAAALRADFGRYSPTIGLDPDRADGGLGLAIDIEGCAHLFGGEAAMVTDMRARAVAAGYGDARIAAAPTLGAAWALARFGDGASVHIDAADLHAVLDPLPAAALRLNPATAAVLDRLGLRRIGDLRAAPRAGLAARFGAVLGRRIDQAFGLRVEPVVGERPAPDHIVRRRFAEPIAAPQDLARTLAALADDLSAALSESGKGVRKLALTFHRADGRVERVQAGTSRARRDAQAIVRLLSGKLDQVDPGFGIDAAALEARVTEDLAPEQTTAVAETPQTETAMLADRLGARLGPRRVARLVVRDAHPPERRQAQLSLFDDRAWSAPPPYRRPAAPPPVRLEPSPAPIGAHAAAPGRPPTTLAIDGAPRRLRWVEGPERISGEWWRPDAAPDRDYWRAEDETGARWLVFREIGADGAEAWRRHGALG